MAALIVDYVREVLEIPAANTDKPAQPASAYHESSVMSSHGKRDDRHAARHRAAGIRSYIDLGRIAEENRHNE